MTQIKDSNGNWVTVAGGQRMWVGTKAQLDAALAAGELEDNTLTAVLDDYTTGSNPECPSAELHETYVPDYPSAELHETYVPDYDSKIQGIDEKGIRGSVVCQRCHVKKMPSGDLLVQFGFGPDPKSSGSEWLFYNNINLKTSIGTLTLPDSMNLKDYSLSGRVHCDSFKSGEITVEVSKSAGTNVMTLKGYSNVANILSGTVTYAPHAGSFDINSKLYVNYFWSTTTLIMNHGRP